MKNLISLFFLLVSVPVFAHGWGNTTINETTIITGISDSDLSQGLSMAAAVGGHQFDFATYEWQGSVVGAWYDDTDSVSFGLGKRWEKVDALFHVNYTQNGSKDLFVTGATWRF